MEDIDYEALAQTVKITSALSQCATWFGNDDMGQSWQFGILFGKVMRMEYLTEEEEVSFNRMWQTSTPNATLLEILIEDGDIKPHAIRFLENGVRGEEFKTWLALVRKV